MQRSDLITVMLLTAVVLGAVGCGGSASSEPEDQSGQGQVDGTITMSVDGGAVYTFTTSSCVTHQTDPSSFLVDPGYSIEGRSAENYTLYLARAAMEESPDLQPVIYFESDPEANGQNKAFVYNRDGAADLEVDGGRLFGKIQLKLFLYDFAIEGEGFTASIEATC